MSVLARLESNHAPNPTERQRTNPRPTAITSADRQVLPPRSKGVVRARSLIAPVAILLPIPIVLAKAAVPREAPGVLACITTLLDNALAHRPTRHLLGGRRRHGGLAHRLSRQRM